MKRALPVCALLLLVQGLDQGTCEAKRATPGRKLMQLQSSAFANGGMIPSKFTCDGENVSPPLNWAGVPTGTKTLALICDDPDAPSKTWVHWVLFDLPPEPAFLDENLPAAKTLPSGARQGSNDFQRIGYGGPCPPGGTHRYFFKLYALDQVLELPAGSTKQQLLKAMEGHVLGQTELVGRYQRKGG